MAPVDKPRGSEPVNLVLKGTRLEGDLNFASQLVVAGHIKGNITCQGTLFIERGGRVEGRVQAPGIVAHGELEGTVLATAYLEICTGAVVGGDVSARSVRVDQGAMLTANLTISSDLPDSLPPVAPVPAAAVAPAEAPAPVPAPAPVQAAAPVQTATAVQAATPVPASVPVAGSRMFAPR
jgi:cytoskeletal protein CcmA (bactofilin family)